jgi:hypothetical protein
MKGEERKKTKLKDLRLISVVVVLPRGEGGEAEVVTR